MIVCQLGAPWACAIMPAASSAGVLLQLRMVNCGKKSC